MDLLRAANRVFVAAAVDENAAKLMREKLPMATIQIGDAPILLAAADAAIVKSGTVTLEAALAQTPTVIFYRSSWMARQVIRWKEFYLPFFGLPNILCGRFVAPELLNNEVSPQSLATAVLRLLENKTARREMCAAFVKYAPNYRLTALYWRHWRCCPDGINLRVDEAGRGSLAGPVVRRRLFWASIPFPVCAILKNSARSGGIF